MWKRIKKWMLISGIMLLLLLFFIGASNFWIIKSTQQQTFDSIKKIPLNDVALVLGTSKYTRGGYKNLYFSYRIEAAVELFRAGKVKHILVSGDNSLKEYNEPKQMKAELVKKGIPESAISLDYAGFRTLDSVVRSKEVFGQQNITIVSQAFHNQRALFIANHRDINAVAFNAKDVNLQYGFKVQLREYLAKCKAVLDIIILNKQPKFLGKKIELDIK